MQPTASTPKQLHTPRARGGDTVVEGDGALAREAPAATADQPRTPLRRPAVECPSAEEARVMMVRVDQDRCTPCQLLSTEVCLVRHRTDPTASDRCPGVLSSIM